MIGTATGLALSLAFLLSSTAAKATETSPVRTVCIGGPTLVFRFGPITIVTDPMLGQGAEAFRMIGPNDGASYAAHARLNALPDVLIDTADLVLVSHDHADHLDESTLARLSARRFVVPVAQEDRVKRRGIAEVLGLPWRAAHTLRKNGYSVRITAVPAQHSARPEVRELVGDVNGYWLEFRHRHYRRTVYWTGDSFPVAAELGADLREPDLLVPHLGGIGVGGRIGRVGMGAREALSFARTVAPKRVLPIDRSTFSLHREPIDVFARAAAGQPWKLDLIEECGELVLD